MCRIKAFASAVTLSLYVLLLALLCGLLLTSCAPPKVTELLKAGVDCQAAITIPEDAERGEPLNVAVRIYDCKEVEGK